MSLIFFHSPYIVQEQTESFSKVLLYYIFEIVESWNIYDNTYNK